MNKNKNNGNNTIVLETRNLADMKERAGNLYEAIAIISKRANQIALQIKEELHGKL